MTGITVYLGGAVRAVLSLVWLLVCFVVWSPAHATSVADCQAEIANLTALTESATFTGKKPKKDRKKLVKQLEKASKALTKAGETDDPDSESDKGQFDKVIKKLNKYQKEVLKFIAKGRLNLGNPPNPDLVGTADTAIACIADISALEQLTVATAANRTYGVIGTVFDISAVLVSSNNSRIDYQWSISDGRSFTGERISVSFGQAGFHQITLTATSSTGAVSTADVGVIVHNPNDPAPDVLGLPNLLGDVNNDGKITLVDAHLAAKFAGRVDPLSAVQQSAADLDFSGDITFTDVNLIAGAILGGVNLPDQLVSDHGMPGAIITLVSPSLSNPEDLIEIGIGDQLQTPNRPIMGYVSFIVPFTGNAATPGLKDIKLLVNGSETASYRFTVLESDPVPQDPAAEVAGFLDEIKALLEINERLVAEQLDAVQISPEDRSTLLAAATAGRVEAETIIAQLQSLLNGAAGGELAEAFFLAANANGLNDYRSRLQTFLQASSRLSGNAQANTEQLLVALAAISPDGVCDNLLPALCALKESASLLKTGNKVVSAACDILLAAALGAVVVTAEGPFGESALLALWSSVCAPLEFAIDTASVISDLVSNIDADLRLSASTTSPASGEAAVIKATLDVFGLDDVCQIGGSQGAKKIVDVLAERVVNRMIQRKITVRSMAKIFTELGEDFLQKFLGLLKSAAGKVITSTGIDKAILAFAQPYCEDIFGAELIMNASRVLTGPEPNEGTLTFQTDGTAEYTCPTSPGSTDPLTVTLTATKDICGTTQTKTVDVQCATRDVTITMGDNGSLNDDIFEVRVDGVTVLTTSSPTRSASVTLPLPVGSSHAVQMLGRAAPDGVGTYFINFTGARVTSGDATSGSDLVPGAVKNFTIEVLP